MQSVLVFLCLLTGCAAGPETAAISEQAIFPTPAATLPSPTPTTTPVRPTPTFTLTPSLSSSPTARDPFRVTPATIMMHRSNANFDSVLFLQELVAILKAHSFHVITYREISANPAITTIEQGRLAIITIDDISLQYPMAPSVEAMIEILLEAGYPAVLGIVTEGVNPDPLVVSRLRQLNELGWEIATHTDQHSNLGLMEQSAPRYIFTEISLSQDKIENAVGVRPITLILPEGQMVNDRTQIERAGIVWIVGINGGNSYDSTRDSFYVGREGPSGTAALTFEIMMRRFAP